MADDMSDNDDLDAFARLFGATPETPPEGIPATAGSWTAPPTAPAGPAGPAAAGSAGDPLGWLLSDGPAATVFPVENAQQAAPFATTTALAEPTQVLPTRRSLAAEAARASRDSSRRNLIILASVGALVLILVVVLVVVLVAKNGSSGSPDALLKQPQSPAPSSSSAVSSTPTPTATPSETPTPTPTPTQVRTVAAPPPSPPTVTAGLPAQPSCSGGTTTTITITYTSANAATLTLSSSDGSVNSTLTPSASGTIPSVLYKCDGSGESYTLTVYSSAEGMAPASATVTPVPTS